MGGWWDGGLRVHGVGGGRMDGWRVHGVGWCVVVAGCMVGWDGWRVHGWVSICTHPPRSVGHDGQVGMGVMGGWAWAGGCGCDGWVGMMGRWV